MRKLGLLLMIGGFLAGAYVAVSQEKGVRKPPFLAALAVAAVGVATSRMATHRAARSQETLSTNIIAIEESLGRVVEEARRLEAEKETINVYDLRTRIDESFADHLHRFVEARETLAHRFGLQAYADVMNHFAAGERYLNRVWSASTDGYQDEAHLYITKARDELSAALDRFRELGG